MTYRHYDHCEYCDTEYTVEFDNEDCELMYCPSCGELILEIEDDEIYELDDDGEWDIE